MKLYNMNFYVNLKETIFARLPPPLASAARCGPHRRRYAMQCRPPPVITASTPGCIVHEASRAIQFGQKSFDSIRFDKFAADIQIVS